MKLIHTADLHIGKIINDFNMRKDQQYILEQMLEIIIEEEAKALIIAGDVYDRSVPASEAVALLDWFLSKLIEMGIEVFLISGNHDSPERISFAGSILEKRGLHIAGTFSGEMKKVSLEDQYGNVNLFLLPFAKPGYIKEVMGKEEIVTYEDSVRAVLEQTNLCKEERNILVTHHFVTNGGREPEISDSESRISIGGVDNVEVSAFDAFDYVALGHIHGPQKIGRETVRYAGSPLKYSFSEVFHKKSVTVVEFKEKGNICLTVRELKPLHNFRKIKGELKDLMAEEIYSQGNRLDYLQITLTNREELIDPLSTLRAVYPNIMQLVLEKNVRKQEGLPIRENGKRFKTIIELYQEFYETVTEYEFDGERRKVIEQLIDELEGEIL